MDGRQAASADSGVHEWWLEVDIGGWISGPCLSASETDLRGLQHHWGDEYEITLGQGMFRAVHRATGAARAAATAPQMYAALLEDAIARSDRY